MGLIEASLAMTCVVFLAHKLSEPLEQVAVRNKLQTQDWFMLFLFYWAAMLMGVYGVKKMQWI